MADISRYKGGACKKMASGGAVKAPRKRAKKMAVGGPVAMPAGPAMPGRPNSLAMPQPGMGNPGVPPTGVPTPIAGPGSAVRPMGMKRGGKVKC